MRIRDSAFSFAACEKLAYERSRGIGSAHLLPAGRVRLQAVKWTSSVPKNCFRPSNALHDGAFGLSAVRSRG
jgi:hypothetical protein